MPRAYKNLPRLYTVLPLAGDKDVTLEREQCNYLVAVLRMKAGDELVLFNGRDGAWRTRLTNPHKKAAELEVVEQIAAQTPPSDLWYGFAPLKSARLDYVVQKATELGAGCIQPVITRFTQVSRLKADKLKANIIEAAEQCEVLSVPELAPEISLEALLKSWTVTQGNRRLIVCDETARSASPVETIADLAGQPVGMLIGPEGGFAEEELALLRAQAFVVPISLGPLILRADTAGVAALALVQAIIGNWR